MSDDTPRARLRLGTIAFMGAALCAYVALHSPVRALLSTALGRPVHSAYFSLLHHISIDSAAALLAIVLAILAGALVTTRFDVASFERTVVFGVSAFAFVVVPAAVVAGISAASGTHLLRPPVGPLLTAVPAGAVVAFAAAGRQFALPRVPRLTTGSGLSLLLVIIATALVAASAAISLTQPPTGFDALAFHAPMAVYLWRDGDFVSYLNRAPGGFALAHPGAAELWFGLLWVAGGEHLANIGQLPLAILGAAAVRVLSRRLGFGARASLFGACAFLIAPIVVMQIGMQLNDVAAAALVMAAAALALPSQRWTTSRAVIVGLALALATTVKLAVIPAAGAVGLFALADSARRGARLSLVCALTLAFAVAVAPWWIRNAIRYGNPLYPQALPIVGRGVVIGEFEHKDARFIPSVVAWPLYPIVEPVSDQSGFGALFVVGALPGLAGMLSRRRARPLALYASMIAFTLPPWWMLTMHEPRHLLVLFGIGFAFVPAAAIRVQRRFRRAALVLLAVAATFSALTTVDQGLIPRLRQVSDREQYYDRFWGVDPEVAGRRESEPLLYNTGYAPLSYAGDYPLLGPTLGRLLFTIDTAATTNEIVSLMRRSGVRYAYVPVSAAAEATVRAKYSAAFFDLERRSSVTSGDGTGVERLLYRLRDERTTDDDNEASLRTVEPANHGKATQEQCCP